MTEFQNDISTNTVSDVSNAMGRLEINRSALAHNYETMSQKSGAAHTAAVVKANAYGLGLENVIPTLISHGCEAFFVANLVEAISLRQHAPKADIYIFNGYTGEDIDIFKSENFFPCLNSLHQLILWQTECQKLGAALPACLNIDTGFNRLGLCEADIMTLSETNDLWNGWTLSLIMSHLACADTPTHPMNQAQRERFLNMTAMLPPAPRSLANSAGVLLGTDFHFDLTRCGISLYGGAPQSTDTALESVVSLYGYILQIKEVSKGDTVGYGATYIVESEQKIAIVSVGYADGFLRSTGHANPPYALAHINEQPAPIIGRISMDLLAIDITSIKDQIKPGTMVELLGKTSLIDAVASQAGTISYELLTGLGNRYKRICL